MVVILHATTSRIYLLCGLVATFYLCSSCFLYCMLLIVRGNIYLIVLAYGLSRAPGVYMTAKL